MKRSEIIILVLVIIGIAAFIFPEHSGHWPKSHIALQLNKIRKIGMTMVYFEMEFHRLPKSLEEIAIYVRVKKPDVSIEKEDFSFTYPDGHEAAWILSPVIDGKEYLAASPEFIQGSDSLQIVMSLDGQKIIRKKTEPNQSPEPMPMAVTPPAAQASRQP